MGKQRFLDQLRVALTNRVPEDVVADNLRYYENYIDSQVRSGISEEEVLRSLGNPRLIAKTIIDTQKTTVDSKEDSEKKGYYEEHTGYNRHISNGASKWLWLILGVLILMLIVSVLMSVLSFLTPFILPLIIILFFVKLFRDWLK